MPINKDALKRYRIIDQLLADPSSDYTTDKIQMYVNRDCEEVSLRMIQKDIKNIEEYFGKKLIRNAGGRGTVKYEDQSTPLFYKELTTDEEEVLREVLKSLGQFNGLDNFIWLDMLKRKLAMDSEHSDQPYISFSKNDGLQIPKTLLGRLFTAISRKKVIRVYYTKFGGTRTGYTVYPYQLKQYNNRWFLLCTPLANERYAYNKEFIMNLALDRMDENFDYIEDEPYYDTPVDLQARFDEIIGVTLDPTKEQEDIYFAVTPGILPYIQTKWLHNTQILLDEDSQKMFKEKYPSLTDHTFFSISCRENNELYNNFCSYAGKLVLVEPVHMREHLREMMELAAQQYQNL